MGELQGFTTDWRRLRRGRFVGVDCDYSSAQLTLSHHWYGRSTPVPFRHDLASGAALAWAAHPGRDGYLGKATYVYNDHFDVDGFLAAWVALNPDEALALQGEILDAAASGDFDEWASDRAVQFALLGEAIDDPRRSALAREATGLEDGATDEALYLAVLKELPELLRRPEKYEDLWRPTYEDIRAQVALFSKGSARTEEAPSDHLSVIHTSRILHLRAALARSSGDRMLQVVHAPGGYMYMFRYRPYLGYRIISRPLTPLHEVATVARHLNDRWPTEGEEWRLVGSWSRRLVLTAADGGRRRVPRTEPEVAVPLLQEVLHALDATNPGPRVAY